MRALEHPDFSRFTPLMLLLAAAPLTGVTAPAPPWHVEQSDVRFTVSGQSESDGVLFRATQCAICPTGMNPESLQPLVYADDGSRVGCRLLYAREGDPMTLLFDSSKADPAKGDFHIYLLDKRTAAVELPWQPDSGILLESRVSTQALTELSVEAFRTAWNQAEWTNGCSVVSGIYQSMPASPPRHRTPHEYQAHREPGLLLSRYTGSLQIPPLDTNVLHGIEAQRDQARAARDAAHAKAIQLQTAIRKAEYDVAYAHRYPEKATASRDVLLKRFQAVQSEYDLHGKTLKAQAVEAMNKANEVIDEMVARTYVWYAGSRGGSHVLIDGNPVLSWSPEKNPNLIGGRCTNLEKTVLNFTNTSCAVEYLHYGRPHEFLAMLAWKPPAETAPLVIPESMFGPVSAAAVREISFKDPEKAPLMFSWRIDEDLRCLDVGDMVQVDFQVMPVRPGCHYRWDFGDGRRGEGPRVPHLFFLAGLYTVTVVESPDDEAPPPARHATQTVCAHVLWDKPRPADLGATERRLAETDLSTAHLAGLINAYAFARKAGTEELPLRQWREQMRRVLAARLQEFAPEQMPWAKALADDARDFRVQAYDEAQAGYETIVRRLNSDAPLRTEALLELAGLLVDCQDKAGEALQHLDELDVDSLPPHAQRAWRLIRAAALLGQGRAEEALALLQALAPASPLDDTTPQAIKHLGELRQAEGIVAQHSRHAAQLTAALEIVEAVMAEDPRRALSARANLIKLDVFLGRGEHVRARLLAERLLTLDSDPASRPALLWRRLRALNGLGNREAAAQVLEELIREYPYDPATAEAKKEIPTAKEPEPDE